ncbi:STAS/SEC14 domain-containing protein [bacterium]|nr:STAS/SEC14 domain-containing protein [bacterium]
MPTIRIQAQLSASDLLGAVEQLPPDELELFVQQVLMLRAQRSAASLAPREAELFAKINRTLAAAERQEYRALVQRRQAETLTESDRDRLLELSDRQEALHADRMAALIELAQLRQIPLPDLMAELGIPSHQYAQS